MRERHFSACLKAEAGRVARIVRRQDAACQDQVHALICSAPRDLRYYTIKMGALPRNCVTKRLRCATYTP